MTHFAFDEVIIVDLDGNLQELVHQKLIMIYYWKVPGLLLQELPQ
jgi:hypothetical protein